eukprot:scaffold697_cov320-Prasinococcus_capsulatus_cf.AAC.7
MSPLSIMPCAHAVGVRPERVPYSPEGGAPGSCARLPWRSRAARSWRCPPGRASGRSWSGAGCCACAGAGRTPPPARSCRRARTPPSSPAPPTRPCVTTLACASPRARTPPNQPEGARARGGCRGRRSV